MIDLGPRFGLCQLEAVDAIVLKALKTPKTYHVVTMHAQLVTKYVAGITPINGVTVRTVTLKNGAKLRFENFNQEHNHHKFDPFTQLCECGLRLSTYNDYLKTVEKQ